MPRALALRYVDVADGGRAGYLAALAERATAARAAAFHFWAFEAEGAPGRFVEFLEAPTAAALDIALADPAAAPAPAWERFTGVADS